MKVFKIVFALLGCMGTLFAESIGINFTGPEGGASVLEPTVTAGMSKVKQDHWNNLTVTAEDLNGHQNEGGLMKVQNSAGLPVHTMTVRVSASETTQIWPSNGMNWGFTEGDGILHLGMIYPQATIKIRNIPYVRYHVVLYSGATKASGLNMATIEADGRGTVDVKNIQWVNHVWLNGVYTFSTAVTEEEAKASNGGNIIVFKDNTARSITITWDGKGGGWTGLAGLQIIPIN